MPKDQNAAPLSDSNDGGPAGPTHYAPFAGATSPDRTQLRRRYLGAAIGGALVITGLGLWVSAHHGSAEAETAQPAPPQVTVAQPLLRDIADQTELTGQFSPVNQVTLLAQVSGYLTEIHFQDGQVVRKGDLLFVIDPRPYQIQLQQANAQYQSALAASALAEKDVRRATQLSKAGAQSVEVLDQAIARQAAAQGAMQSAQAAIDAARLNLRFTRIVAPFDGRMSNRRVSLGSLVSGGSAAATPTVLSSVVSLDPIYLDFDMSEADYVAYQKAVSGRSAAIKDGVPISLDGETVSTRTGRLDFLDNQIDRGSGTLHARATLANADRAIAPGQFARVRVPASAPRPQLLIPDEAIATDQSTKTVMVVKADGVAVARRVELGALEPSGLRVVTKGLAPTDRVVVNGLMRVTPGLKVAARLQPLSATQD